MKGGRLEGKGEGWERRGERVEKGKGRGEERESRRGRGRGKERREGGVRAGEGKGCRLFYLGPWTKPWVLKKF